MNARRLCRAFAVTAAALAATSTPAQQSRSDEPRLDASGAANLERSVARLRNTLPPRDQEDFDAALAMIWIQRTANDGDLDGDDDVDLDDLRLLEQDASDLLTQIHRGNLVSAIEARARSVENFKAADYFKLLDGLGYDDVLALAGHTRAEDYLKAVRQTRSQPVCFVDSSRASGSRVRQRTAEECANQVAAIRPRVGIELNTVIEALNAQRYAEARSTLEKLTAEKLTSYERSKAEQILYSIAMAEQDLPEAREHLLAALEAGGLNPQETVDALQRIRAIESRLSAAPQ